MKATTVQGLFLVCEYVPTVKKAKKNSFLAADVFCDNPGKRSQKRILAKFILTLLPPTLYQHEW